MSRAKSTAKKNDDIGGMTFEGALAELEDIVRKLESGSSHLEESIDDYTRGTLLREHCSKKLADARLKVEKISKNNDGSVTAEPFDVEG